MGILPTSRLAVLSLSLTERSVEDTSFYERYVSTCNVQPGARYIDTSIVCLPGATQTVPNGARTEGGKSGLCHSGHRPFQDLGRRVANSATDRMFVDSVEISGRGYWACSGSCVDSILGSLLSIQFNATAICIPDRSATHHAVLTITGVLEK